MPKRKNEPLGEFAPSFERFLEDIMRRARSNIKLAAEDSVLKENLLEARVKALEKEVRGLKGKVLICEEPTKSDLVYEKYKEELEKNDFGKIIAIDTEKEEIVGIGDSILEAYRQAVKKSSKKTFAYKRVGYGYLHKI